jgi:histone acetyltransferase (RNA polymerase elongator complex component)
MGRQEEFSKRISERESTANASLEKIREKIAKEMPIKASPELMAKIKALNEKNKADKKRMLATMSKPTRKITKKQWMRRMSADVPRRWSKNEKKKWER